MKKCIIEAIVMKKGCKKALKLDQTKFNMMLNKYVGRKII